MAGFLYLPDEVLEALNFAPREVADAIEAALIAVAVFLWTRPERPASGRG